MASAQSRLSLVVDRVKGIVIDDSTCQDYRSIPVALLNLRSIIKHVHSKDMKIKLFGDFKKKSGNLKLVDITPVKVRYASNNFDDYQKPLSMVRDELLVHYKLVGKENENRVVGGLLYIDKCKLSELDNTVYKVRELDLLDDSDLKIVSRSLEAIMNSVANLK